MSLIFHPTLQVDIPQMRENEWREFLINTSVTGRMGVVFGNKIMIK